MPAAEVPGTVLGGKYRLERILARGRSAVVWEARHLVTARVVAVKLFVDPVANLPRARERMLLEARVSSLAAHPNLLPVDDVLELDDGRAALVMERLVGESLRARIERGPLPVAGLAALFGPALEALEAAHAAGLVHRDLKPDNLFVANDPERLIVLDFGIAKFMGDESLDLTSTGVSMGTPFYMAPEQLFGDDDVDSRADVWALGVVLYETITGQRPTEAANLGQLLKKISARALPRLDAARAGGHSALAAVVNRMLDVRKDERPALAEVRVVLASAPKPAPRRWWPWVVAGVGVLGVAAARSLTPPVSYAAPAALRGRVAPAAVIAAVPSPVPVPAASEPAPPMHAAPRGLPAIASSERPPSASAPSAPWAPTLQEDPPF